MRVLAIGFMLLSLQASPARTTVASLAGAWTTTVVPDPGAAPTVAPSFTLAIQDGKVMVTFEHQTKADEAVVFGGRGGSASENVAVLVIKYPSAAATRMVMLRPIAAGQIRYELYVELAGDRSKGNFYYAEVFKKSR